MVALEYALLAAVVASAVIVGAGGLAAVMNGTLGQVEAAVSQADTGESVRPTPF